MRWCLLTRPKEYRKGGCGRLRTRCSRKPSARQELLKDVESVGAVVYENEANFGIEEHAKESASARRRTAGIVEEFSGNLCAVRGDLRNEAIISIDRQDVAIGRNG